MKVQKSKDLLGCTDRQDVQTIFQGSNYDSNSVSIIRPYTLYIYILYIYILYLLHYSKLLISSAA